MEYAQRSLAPETQTALKGRTNIVSERQMKVENAMKRACTQCGDDGGREMLDLLSKTAS